MGLGFGVGEEAQADQGAGEVEEGHDRGGLAVVADREPAERDEPRLRPLHDPSVPAQPLARLDATPGDLRGDPALPQRLSQVGAIESLVAVQTGWAPARAARLARGTADRLDRVHQRRQQPRIVHVGRRELHAQRRPCRSTRRWYSEPALPRAVGFGAGVLAATLARLQAIASRSPSQSRRTWRTRRQNPSACQWRNRPQQVLPLP
jgi:hypothetical protein